MNERHFRLYERIVAIEDSLEALGPIDKLIERIEELEKMVKQTKTVLGFDEACKYIGVSESLLYKLTAAKEVPHYKGAPDKPCGVGCADANPKLLLNDT